MPVEIKIMVQENQTQEYKAIDSLMKNLEYDFQNNYPTANGRIYLYSNINMYGCSGKGVSDLDILVMGELENVYVDLIYQHNQTCRYRIDSFILTVEQKGHEKGIEWENTNFFVPYPNNYKKNLSQQSREQLNAMREFLNQEGLKPLVNNVIFFTGICSSGLRGITNQAHNAIAQDCTFQDIMQARFNAHMSAGRDKNTGEFYLSMSNEKDMFDRVASLFEKKYLPPSSGLTRKRVELLNNQINKDVCQTLLGPNFSILKGRAGTGKTITLLQAAIMQSADNMCVVLTYNHALLGDIKRLMQYRAIDGGTKINNIEFNSTQEFFCRLMKNYNIQAPNDSNLDFETQYFDALKKFCKQTESIKEKRSEYIFIDEAQDWAEEERDILFNLYPPQNIIIADGVDQFVRNGNRGDWQNIDGQINIERTISLRQKSNLVYFINTYAEENGIDWSVTPNSKLCGGHIVIKETEEYTKGEHSALVAQCAEDGCTNYDILLLVTPSYVDSANSGRFKCTDAFNKCGFNIFDGTNIYNRKATPMGDDESRVFQYDSCRGLEGWCTVCIDFDELIKYKYNIYRQVNPDAIAYKQAILWSLMPLTRAVDTIVITLKNPNGDVGKMLKCIADKYDFVDWSI